jgi:hypothetical protein
MDQGEAENEIAELQSDLTTASKHSERLVAIADENFGPFPVQDAEANMTAIERGIYELRLELAEARKREMRWIPVSERLPERGTSVLVIQDKFRPAFTGMMLEDGDWIEDGEGFQIDVPAYWMPLPPAPEQDEKPEK